MAVLYLYLDKLVPWPQDSVETGTDGEEERLGVTSTSYSWSQRESQEIGPSTDDDDLYSGVNVHV